MIEATYWVCSDALTLAAQLGQAQELPTPDILRQRINALFSGMAQRGRQVNLSDEDLRDATYAIAALMDEQILRSSWSGRTAWMSQPLQLIYFNENTAGEGFFQRLSALQQMPGKEHLVQVYYLCLALGFQGRYAVPGAGDAAAICDHARNVVARRLPASETISPAGYPRGAAVTGQRRVPPLVGIGIGVCALCILVFVTLWVLNSSNASDAVDQMNRARVTASAS